MQSPKNTLPCLTAGECLSEAGAAGFRGSRMWEPRLSSLFLCITTALEILSPTLSRLLQANKVTDVSEF